MSTCTVDEDSIREHFKSSIFWNTLPYIGPAVSSSIAAPLPPDQSDQLSDLKGQFDAATDAWQNLVTQGLSGVIINVSTLTKLLPSYVHDRIEIGTLPNTFQINVLWVQVISIIVVLGVLIIFGRY